VAEVVPLTSEGDLPRPNHFEGLQSRPLARATSNRTVNRRGSHPARGGGLKRLTE
jgi:hypothetical protein